MLKHKMIGDMKRNTFVEPTRFELPTYGTMLVRWFSAVALLLVCSTALGCIEEESVLPLVVYGEEGTTKYQLEVRRIEFRSPKKLCDGCRESTGYLEFIFKFNKDFEVRDQSESGPTILIAGADRNHDFRQRPDKRTLVFTWVEPEEPVDNSPVDVVTGDLEELGLPFPLWRLPYTYERAKVPVIVE